MKILVLSAVRFVAINIQDSPSKYENESILLVLQVNGLVLREVNAEIAKLSICRLSCHFFMKTLPILIGFSAFMMRMAPIMIGNRTF